MSTRLAHDERVHHDAASICQSADVQSAVQRFLAPGDQRFFERVWSRPLLDYVARLRDIGFSDVGCVLDAGAGMGQWSVALATLNRDVWAVDIDSGRVSVVESIVNHLKLDNITCTKTSLAKTSFESDSFDAIFCYSVLYGTDIRTVLTEMYRILKPGGHLYISTNGQGYYVRQLLLGGSRGADFSPRWYAFQALIGNAAFPWWSKHANRIRERIIGPRALRRLLAAIGFEPDAVYGPEGTLSLSGRASGMAFFRPRFLGLLTVFDVLARKPGGMRC
jgi:SAM-dependent methyltransferase